MPSSKVSSRSRAKPSGTNAPNGAGRAGSFFAPKTRIGFALRNAFYGVLTSKRFLGVFERVVKQAASDFALPNYAA
jgi:hypothetical protein